MCVCLWGGVGVGGEGAAGGGQHREMWVPTEGCGHKIAVLAARPAGPWIVTPDLTCRTASPTSPGGSSTCT